MNSLRNQIALLRGVYRKAPIDLLCTGTLTCTSETICLEVTISKKKCRPSYNNNKEGFFKDLDKSLSNIQENVKISLLLKISI